MLSSQCQKANIFLFCEKFEIYTISFAASGQDKRNTSHNRKKDKRREEYREAALLKPEKSPSLTVLSWHAKDSTLPYSD